jgi:hypothetical protein
VIGRSERRHSGDHLDQVPLPLALEPLAAAAGIDVSTLASGFRCAGINRHGGGDGRAPR